MTETLTGARVAISDVHISKSLTCHRLSADTFYKLCHLHTIPSSKRCSIRIFIRNVWRDSQLNDINGWLALLSTDRVDRLDELVSDYPQMESICQDMASYLERPEEVIGMFSDALKILDENTVHYMMDEMQKQIDENARKLDESLKQLNDNREQLDNANKQLDDANKEIERLRKLLESK